MKIRILRDLKAFPVFNYLYSANTALTPLKMYAQIVLFSSCKMEQGKINITYISKFTAFFLSPRFYKPKERWYRRSIVSKDFLYQKG